MISLSFDLERRTNPEKSRLFDIKIYKKHLILLKEIYYYIKKFYPFNPIKISIIGTNGKGSTGFFLSQLFYYNDLNVGFYSSPHLISFLERIQINLKIIEESQIDEYYDEFIKKIINSNKRFQETYNDLTYFEVLTIFSIYLFYKLQLPIQIYEAGLGGRFDATKIVSPDIVILTNVSLDHTKVLGNTKEKILNEKLGILSRQTKMLLIGDPFLKSYFYNKNLKIPIQFFHIQKKIDTYLEYNKEFAIDSFKKICEFYKISIKKPNFYLTPPYGRIQIHKVNSFYFIYDVSHNPRGMYHFLISLRKVFPEICKDNTIIILGLLKDRSYKHMKRLFLWTKLKHYYPLPYVPNINEFLHSNPFDVLDIEHYDSIKNKTFIIFCGTFRLYNIFLELIQKIGSIYETQS